MGAGCVFLRTLRRRMLKNLSIVKKGLLVLLLPVLCQGILLGLLFHRQNEQQDAQRWALHTKDVLLQIDRIVSATLQLQGALLGYVVTGNDEYATAQEEVFRQISPMTASLRALVVDNPQQIVRATAIQEHAQARIDWSNQVNSLMRGGQREEALAKIRTMEGKRMVDQLLKEVETFRDTEEGLDRQRLAHLEKSTSFLSRLLTAGLILTVAAGLLAMYLITRGLTHRIAVLRENSKRLTRGEALVPIVKGSDEIGELDRTFHEMAETIAAARETERQFQETLAKQNVELASANRDLDHQNRENEMFVYSVSHDLRSPLVNLQGFSRELGTARDAMKTMLGSEMDAEARGRALRLIDRDVTEPIRFIQSAVMRLSAIIDALLRLSRAGRVEYAGEVIDLQAKLQRIVEAMSSQTGQKGAKITVQKLPLAFGDPTAVEQIFANLVANAVNYLDPHRPGEIEVGSVGEPAPELAGLQVFYVKDNGLGIAEAYLSKVFTIFQRLHGDIAPGEGIGLALVRRMVERHGGKIWVESKQGVGSTFFVALPPREKSALVVAPRRESTRLASANTPSAPL